MFFFQEPFICSVPILLQHLQRLLNRYPVRLNDSHHVQHSVHSCANLPIRSIRAEGLNSGDRGQPIPLPDSQTEQAPFDKGVLKVECPM